MTEKEMDLAVAPVLMTTIVDRGEGDSVADIFTDNRVYCNLLTHGSGTANKKILSYLGLGETEKDVIFSCMSYAASQTILKTLGGLFKAKKSGYGIAFCISMSGLAAVAGQMLSLDGSEDKRGGCTMENHQHDLIVVITAQGRTDEVMDVARAHGATGGTVLRARGVGAKEAEKFFGITVQAEKDMIFIVVKKELSEEMMSSIVREKGPQTNAKAVAFSVPVGGVAGMKFESWSDK